MREGGRGEVGGIQFGEGFLCIYVSGLSVYGFIRPLNVYCTDSSITKPAATTAFCDASKQLLIHRPPFVLTLHLKRFSQQGRRVKKNGKHISFPFLLDIRPFCTDQCDVCPS